MNLEEALEHVEAWEGENAEVHPTRGSEDERNWPGNLLPIDKTYVVYSYISQWMIHAVIWHVPKFVAAVESVIKEAAKTKKPAHEIWCNAKWDLYDYSHLLR